LDLSWLWIQASTRSPRLGNFEIDQNITDGNADNQSEYVLTVFTPILVPHCGGATPCRQYCEALCKAFCKNRMAIDELNRNGIEDFPDYASPYLQGEPGQKPMITYSVHINPDLPDEGYVQKFRIYGFPEGIRFTADNWTSMNSEDQDHILLSADALADELMLGSGNVF